MKKLILLTSCLTLLLSCGDSNDSTKDPVELITEKHISIKDAEPVLIDIKNPSGSYTLKSSNDNVAIASMLNNQKQFYIWGSEPGKATITLTSEETETEATIEVSISNLISRPMMASSLVRIKTGESTILTPPFDIQTRLLGHEVTNKTVVEMHEAGKGQIELLALKVGESTITLQELNLVQHGYGVYVLDIFQLKIRGINNGSTFPIPMEKGIIETLIDGNGSYNVSIENSEIIEAKVREYTEIEHKEHHQAFPYGAYLVLEGKKEGRSKITITDKENQKVEFVAIVL